MSLPIKLNTDLQQLINDFVSVRQRFADLAETYLKQQLQLQVQQKKLEDAAKELAALKQIKSENERLAKSYDQLKRDYDLLYSSGEKLREEVRNNNQKHLRNLEEELKSAKVESLQQAELHRENVVRITEDYEAKLRDADEKIRQLTRTRAETADDIDHPALKNFKPNRGARKKWPELAVQVTTRGSASRGRGRPRGTASKRKLFSSDKEESVDIM